MAQHLYGFANAIVLVYEIQEKMLVAHLGSKQLRNGKYYDPNRQANMARTTTYVIHCLKTFACCDRICDACKYTLQWHQRMLYKHAASIKLCELVHT